mgnify:CR=1 FL=1
MKPSSEPVLEVEAAVKLADALVFAKTGKHLSTLQTAIFRGAWRDRTYEQIAQESYCSDAHVKMVGAELWSLLSQGLEERVTKKTFRAALERRSKSLSSNPVRTATISEVFPNFNSNQSLEFPGGSVPLNSPFYIERPPIEANAYAEINNPGSLIRIKAPRQMGKTSLLNRILDLAQHQGFHTALSNFQQADSAVFASLDKFLRWFCTNISRQLNLTPLLDEYWDEDMGSKLSCTAYVQGYLLEKVESPLVLALDEVNRIFEYPNICCDFLPLLRSWYETASEGELWQKLRLVVVHTTEVYVPLNINQSPFNVGLPIKLPEFTGQQVQDLAVRHGLNWAESSEIESLMAMVGGHPYLVRLALYPLARQNVSLEQLLKDAPTIAGVYSNHLRRHLANLQAHPELAAALHQVVSTSEPVQLEAITAYKLESMGLIKLEGNQATPSCELYRLYFNEQL